MRVKKYRGATLPEAMAKVRAEMGRDAIILHTQKVSVGGWMGWLGRSAVEVTAAVDEPLDRSYSPEAVRQVVPPAVSAHRAPAPAQPAVTEVALAVHSAASAAPPADPLQTLQQELAEVKGMMHQVMRRMQAPEFLGAVPDSLRDVYNTLVEGGVRAELAAGVVEQIAQTYGSRELSGESARLAADAELSRRLGPPRPIELAEQSRRVVALVGPTGVGKTTTLAKLAAQFALAQKKSVALITADTYRIAAVEQLRTYGEIIGVPVDIVFTPQELKSALVAHRPRDLVLIDTAGRSPRNAMQMSELRSLLEAAQPDEVHLVVSLTTAPAEAGEVLDKFSAAGYNRVLLTKQDENVSPGQILNLAVDGKCPLSYVTTGQNVPDDIEVADPQRLAKAILGG